MNIDITLDSGGGSVGHLVLSSNTEDKTNTNVVTLTPTLYGVLDHDISVVITISGGKSDVEDEALSKGVGKHYDVACVGATITSPSYNTTVITKTLSSGDLSFNATLTIVDNTTIELDRVLTISSNMFFGGPQYLTIVDDRRPGTFDVTDYGAAGDGVTDDTAAVQAAIAAATLTDGGVIYFPNGTYLLNPATGVDIDCATAYGLSFIGESKAGAILKRKYVNGNGQHVFNTQLGGASYWWASDTDSPPIGIIDLTLDGNVTECPVVSVLGTAGVTWTNTGGNTWTRSFSTFTAYNMYFTGGYWSDANYYFGIRNASPSSYLLYHWYHDGTTITVMAPSDPATYFSAIYASAASEQNFFFNLSAYPGHPTTPPTYDNEGSLIVRTENVNAINGQTDAYSVQENCKVYGYHIQSTDVRRGCFTMVGGNSEVHLQDIEANWGQVYPYTEIVFQQEYGAELGYGGRKNMDVYIDGMTGETPIDIAQTTTPVKNFTIEINDFVQTGVRCGYALMGYSCDTFQLTNSTFRGGYIRTTYAEGGKIAYPSGGVITNCNFIAQKDEFSRTPLYATNLLWTALGQNASGDTCTFTNCDWTRDSSLTLDTECPIALGVIVNITAGDRNAIILDACSFTGFQYAIKTTGDYGAMHDWTFTDCVFNIASGGYGFYMYGGATAYEFNLTVDNPTFSGLGGFLQVKNCSAQCTLTLTDCRVPLANSGLASYGTGITSLVLAGDAYRTIVATRDPINTDNGFVGDKWEQGGVVTHTCSAIGYYNNNTGLMVNATWAAVP